MECENSLCIYQQNGKCIVENITINSLGMCSVCIYPDIDKTTLTRAKKKLLIKYNDR